MQQNTRNRDIRPHGAQAMSNGVAHFRIVIVGAGFAGLGMAIRLKQQGINDFTVLERADDVGGAWRDNTYPGCACDVPSHLYSFSFALNPNWSHAYAPQSEIWEYLRACNQRFGIAPHIQWNAALLDATWDEAAQQWHITTPQGKLTATILVLGQGPLSDPAIPALPGLDRFQGALFHSANWNHAHDLRGERVAVIGTGASAVQFIPHIQPQVGELILFQRTPPWIMPRNDHVIPPWKRALYRRLPWLQRIARAGIYWSRELSALALVYRPQLMRGAQRQSLAHLATQVKDPVLRAKLTPHYTMGCKRILLSDDYYPALTQANATVITDAISDVREHSIVTADGQERAIDTIIFATGFRVIDMPIADKIHGHGGQSLMAAWRGGIQAYLGTAVAGFPNMFLLIGPNTGLGHNSMVYMIESQLAYILDSLNIMERHHLATLEVRHDQLVAYNDALQRKMQGTVWASGCKSWYLDASGRNATIWPGFTFAFRRKTRHFDRENYRVIAALPATPAQQS